MKPMYRVNCWNYTYFEVTPVIKTVKTVTVRLAEKTHRGKDTERQDKSSSHAKWFDTELQAQEYIGRIHRSRIGNAQAQIREAEEALRVLEDGGLRIETKKYLSEEIT